MKKRSVLSIMLITLILFLLIGVLAQEICITSETGAKTCTDVDIPALAQNFEDYKKLPPKLQSYILEDETSFNQFLGSFKDASPEEQAKFFYEVDDGGELILSDDSATKLAHKLGDEKFSLLLQEYGNKAFTDLYGNFPDGTKPEIKKVEIKNVESLKREGRKWIGKNGEYIQFGKGKDQIHGAVEEIYYREFSYPARDVNGDLLKDNTGEVLEETSTGFSLKYKGGRMIDFTGEGVTLDEDGRGIYKNSKGDLSYIGGDKKLNFLYGQAEEGKESRISIVPRKDGNGFILRISPESDPKNTVLRTADIHGNDVYWGINEQNIQDGTLSKFGSLVIILGEREVNGKVLGNELTMWVRSGKITTNGYGTMITSNAGFTAIRGELFDKPSQGLGDLQSRVLQGVKEGALEGFNSPGGLVDTISGVAETTKELWKKEGLLGMIGKYQAVSIVHGALISATDIGDLSELAGDTIIDIFEGSISGIHQGASSLENQVQDFDNAKASYIMISPVKNEVKSNQEFIVVKAGGDLYSMIDITDSKGKIDRFYANNYGSKESGENLHLVNGNSLTSFIGSETYEPRNRGTSRAQVEIDLVANLQESTNPDSLIRGWSVQQDSYGNFKKYDFTTTKQAIYAGNQYIGGIFKAKPAYYVGGIKIEGSPDNPTMYPGDSENLAATFQVNPSIEARAGPLRRGIFKKVQEDAKISTREITTELNEGVRLALNQEIGKMPGDTWSEKIQNFDTQMRTIDIGEWAAGGTETIWENPDLIPGVTRRELYARVAWDYINNGVWDPNMETLANTGTVVPSKSLSLTSRNGALFGNQQLNFNENMANFLASGIAEDPPENQRTLSLISASKKSSGSSGTLVNMQDYYQKMRNGGFDASITTTQTTTQTTASRPVQQTRNCYYQRAGLFGRRIIKVCN